MLQVSNTAATNCTVVHGYLGCPCLCLFLCLFGISAIVSISACIFFLFSCLYIDYGHLMIVFCDMRQITPQSHD